MKARRKPGFGCQVSGVGCWAVLGAVLLLGALAPRAEAVTFTSSQSGYWTNAATWGGGGTPGSGDDVYICAGHTITNTGTSQISINSLSITGTVTHALGTAHAVNLDIAGNLTIAVAGSINVDGKGQETLGTGPSRSGAGHGGEGPWTTVNGGTAGGTTYGSITNPVAQGSRNNGVGGYNEGGGVVILKVGGDLANNGVISAQGANSPDGNYGGGSGGSINITVAGAMTMPSSARISANGGTGDNEAGYEQGGGGGRIAVKLTGVGQSFANVTTTNITAYGGTDAGGAGPVAGAGTVYLKTQAQTYGDLIVDNNKATQTVPFGCTLAYWGNTLVKSDTYRFDSIATTNNGAMVVGTNATLDLTGCALRSDSTTNSIVSRLIVGTAGSTVLWPSAFTNAATISWTGTNWLSVTSDLTVASGGILTHERYTPANKLNLDLTGNLTIDAGGAIWVSARGAETSGRPTGTRGGCAYGGEGGCNVASTWTTYGSIVNPVDGGSWYGGDEATGRGGGVAMLRVTGLVSDNGIIAANGGNCGGSQGAGSGGSVNLTAGSLGGTGSIQANGGSSGGDPNWDSPGGGGRVAVVLTSGTTFGSVTMSAYGGTTSSSDNNKKAAAGTVYLQTAAQGVGQGTVTIDNNAVTATARTTGIPPAINAAPGELKYASLIVTNRGAMAVTTNATVQALTVASANEPLSLGTDSATVLTLSAMAINGTAYTKSGLYTTNNWNGFDTPANVTGAGAIQIQGVNGALIMLH